MLQRAQMSNSGYDYELEIDHEQTWVKFSFVSSEDGKRYASIFSNGFYGMVKETIGQRSVEDGPDFFALPLTTDAMSSNKFFVPNNQFSDIFTIVLNRWAKETGAPFAFRLLPGPITILDVTFPLELENSISGDFKTDMINSIKTVFDRMTIVDAAIDEVEQEIDLLDDENAVIISEEDGIDDEPDGFKSGIYEGKLVEGASEE